MFWRTTKRLGVVLVAKQLPKSFFGRRETLLTSYQWGKRLCRRHAEVVDDDDFDDDDVFETTQKSQKNDEEEDQRTQRSERVRTDAIYGLGGWRTVH